MIDPDIKQRIQVAGIFLLQSYKILTGTMMSLFVLKVVEIKCVVYKKIMKIQKYIIKH